LRLPCHRHYGLLFELFDEALKLIEHQDGKLGELQEKTAKLGVNITLRPMGEAA